jgi:hypothetical protein
MVLDLISRLTFDEGTRMRLDHCAVSSLPLVVNNYYTDIP